MPSSTAQRGTRDRRTVGLPEGMDARVITAACACVDRKICTPIVLGTPEEVYEFTVNQAKEIGPEGYIITTSCTCPANCKPENLRAMMAASAAQL